MPQAPEAPDATSRRRVVRSLPALILAAFVAVTLGPALLGRGVLLDVDMLTRWYPFSAAGLSGPDVIMCRRDTVDFYLPGIAHIKSQLGLGDIATWSPYEVGGTPLASLPNHAALSPLSLPYFLLPLWLAPAYVKLAELAVVLAGMVAFLGRHGVRRSAGLLAGLVFFSSGFMIMWSNWPHTRVAAFIPALFWALDRAVTLRGPRDVAWVGVIVASMLLGGFPAVTLFALTGGACYVLTRWLFPTRGPVRETLHGWLVAGAGVLLGVALSAVQLLPFVRELGALGVDERQVGRHSPTGQFLTTIAPDVYGTCIDGVSYGPQNPVEGTAFLGAGAVVLALCAFLVRNRVTSGAGAAGASARGARNYLGVTAVVALTLVWLGGPLLDLLRRVPGFDTGGLGRISSLFLFVAAALAGFGLERLLRRSDPDPGGTPPAASPRRWVLGVVLVLATVGLYAWSAHRGWEDLAPGGGAQYERSLALPLVLAAVAVLAAVVACLAPPRWRPVGVLVLVLAILLQSTLFVHRQLPLSQRSSFYPTTPTHRFLQDNLGDERYAATGVVTYPATADYYRLRTPVGHEFTAPRWADLLEAVDPDTFTTKTFSQFPGRVTAAIAAEQPVLDALAVRYWVSRPDDVVGGARLPRLDGDQVSPAFEIGPGDVATCTVPGGSLRGIDLLVDRYPDDDEATVHVRVRTSSGGLENTRTVSRDLESTRLGVGLAGEDLADTGPLTVEVWTSATDGTLVLGQDDDGDTCRAIRPRDDGLRLAHAEPGALVYERLGAQPRIRWAGRSEVVDDADRRVATLAAGTSRDTVLLESADLPVADGANAQVRVVTDEAERIAADVDADGLGYLVVADALVRPGWTATVDGRPVDVAQGDHAFAAIPVPAGEHRVVLSYEAPGLREGATVSLVALLLTLMLGVVPAVLRRRRRGADPAPAST